MILVFVVVLRDSVKAGSVLGLAASFPMYLVFGAVLAKFGYQRKTLRDLRATSSDNVSRRSIDTSSEPTHLDPRRPRPTRRTTTGPSQHRPKNSRKRR